MAVAQQAPKITSRKVAEVFRSNIETGQWKEGAKVPTIRNLAKKIGTSYQTVHNALRIIEGEGLLKCRDRRTAIVAKNGTSQRNINSTDLQVNQIAILVPNFDTSRSKYPNHYDAKSESWSTNIISEIRNSLFEFGYELVLLPIPKSTDDFKVLQQRSFKGHLVFGQPQFEKFEEVFMESGIPWLYVCGVGRIKKDNVIYADNFAGGFKVGRVFSSLGYNKVLLLANNCARHVTDSEKVTGFFNSYIMDGKGTENLKIVAANSIGEQEGYESTKKYINENGIPDGIFATGDWLARGACRACEEGGVAVGKDIGVVGATGLDSSVHYHPPLSVLKQPMDELGHGAAEILIEMIGNEQTVVPSRGFDTKLIIRQSLNIPDNLKKEIEVIIAS